MEAPMSTALRIRGCLIGWLLFALFVPGLSAEPPQAGNDKKVLARFSFRPGEPIILPVKVAGRTFTCLLDTGSTVGVYDPSVPLDEAVGSQLVQTPNGLTMLRKHPAPKALLGDMALHEHGPGFVLGYNFVKMRQATEWPLFGVIGMDFLARRVVELDFDVGEVRFLSKASADCGQEFALKLDEASGLPMVQVAIADVGEPWFIIDSGFCGLESSCLEQGLFNGLVEKNTLKSLASPKLRRPGEPAWVVSPRG
jgi:hypothetical protein